MKAVIYKQYGSHEMLQMAVHSVDCRWPKADPFLVRLVFGLMRHRKNTPKALPGIDTELFDGGIYIYSC